MIGIKLDRLSPVPSGMVKRLPWGSQITDKKWKNDMKSFGQAVPWLD